MDDYLHKNIFADKDFFSSTNDIPLEFGKILGVGTDLPHFEKEVEVDLTSPTEQITEIFQKLFLELDNLSIQDPQAESSTQAQIQIPPKQ